MTIDDLIKLVSTYNSGEEEKIKEAYEFAKTLHEGQYRQSGEPYIIHPLNVAYILASMHADRDTVIAGLLHDTIEDTNTTKEEIEELFGTDVANLVDGVTKLAKMNFSSKEAMNYANTRKIILGITEDVRIIIIKLADRLHNMRTLQYKSEFKQKENALETMDIFVPLAYSIGAHRLKHELEDISLRYLKPKEYEKISDELLRMQKESEEIINEMLFKINRILSDKNIPSEIVVRTKNIYGIYKKICEGNKLRDIHDLHALKIMVETIDECYVAMGAVHSVYPPFNEKFKDYICNPKTNMYRSIHTTLFGPNDKLVQAQIRTFDMDKTNSFGLTAYWDINKGDARTRMQEDLRNKYQFFSSLSEINTVFLDNREFVAQVRSELFGDRIYVYTTKGDIIELPRGSTPIDFAYKIHTDLGNTIVGAVVNDEEVSIYYPLENKDRVKVVTDELSKGPKLEWLHRVQTARAKRKINEYIRK